MSKAKQAWLSLGCLLMLLTNGAGALAQQQQLPEKKIVDGGQGRVVIVTMPPEGERKIGGNSLLIRSGGDEAGIGFQGNVTYFSNEMSFDGAVVKGAPYAAEAVTESVQTLSDGNRIVRKSRALLYRDGEGRTRREQTLNNVGPFATAGDAPHMIFINDPVGGANYVLDPRTHIARKATMFASGFNTFTYKQGPPPPGMELMGPPPDGSLSMKPPPPPGGARQDAVKRVQPEYPPIAKAAGAQGNVSVQVVMDEQGNVTSARATSGHPLLHQAAVDAARQWVFKPTMINGKPVKVSGNINFNFVLDKEGEAAPAPGPPPQPKFQEVKESLGRQTIEGLDAEGTRLTVTIPAGEIGNERPISVVTERWYAPELQGVVLSKHSDPRFGETTYRLTNINRGEPARSLFEVPPDFQLKQDGLMKKEFRMRRDKNEP